jgi:lysozyme
VTLTALDRAAQPDAAQAPSDESVVRTAIVKVASYYARLAQTKTPAEMEALIWQQDSTNGADHGQSCAAFASMTLQLGAQLAGKQSWVTGGSTYPWPVHDWVDARVDPNSASMAITSVLQDAEAHQRWHPLGDGYQPLPGDWVLFNSHVEVVSQYEGGVLSTIGGDSLPNFSVNSHEYSGSLSSHGVQGFVSNGSLPAATAAATSTGHSNSGSSRTASASTGNSGTAASTAPSAAQPQQTADATPQSDQQAEEALAAIPGTTATQTGQSTTQATSAAHPAPSASAAIPGMPEASTTSPPSAAATPQPSAKSSSSAATPKVKPASKAPSASAQPYQRHQAAPASTGSTPGTAAQRAFIDEIAPGAMAAQRTYGVPAAVTIAQAIDESAWGQSSLASEDHNLFGIKGTGPAGSVSLPTQEVYGGETVSVTAQFRVYDNVAQSIEDHGQLLAQSGSYTVAMAHQNSPNSFANALTGVYATDPGYGASLIGLMRQYNLYRYDASATSASTAPASPKAQPHGATQSHPASQPMATPQPRASATQHGASTSPSAKATSPSRSAPTTAPSPQASAPAPAKSGSSRPMAAPAPATAPTSAPASPTAPASGSEASATPSASGAATSGAASQTPASNGSAAGGSLGAAEIPGIPATSTSPSSPAGASSSASTSSPAGPGTSSSESAGTDDSGAGASTSAAVQSSAQAQDATLTAAYRPTSPAQAQHHAATPKKPAKRKGPTVKARRAAPKYQSQMPPAVKNALLSTARKPLARAEFVYRDVAASEGVSWKILAACDWMQCDAHPRYSPVRGEKLGAANPDGTVFHTKSGALTQTARDLVTLAGAVYGIDLTVAAPLSVPELANVFAAYRWGGLLRQHSTSAMEFPYSVQGLTDQFLHMRWPKIADPNAPDKPGSRYRRAFGAVPVVLSLDYPAIVLLSLRAEKPGDPDGPNPRPAAGRAEPAAVRPLRGGGRWCRSRRLGRSPWSPPTRGQQLPAARARRATDSGAAAGPGAARVCVPAAARPWAPAPDPAVGEVERVPGAGGAGVPAGPRRGRGDHAVRHPALLRPQRAPAAHQIRLAVAGGQR